MRADILACWDNSLISKLIRLITGQKVSHVAVMFTDDLVAESLWGGVKIDRIEEMAGNYYILRYEGLTQEQQEKIVKFLRDSIDFSYDYRLLLLIGSHKLLGTRISDNSTKYICSELVYDAFKNAGIDIAPQVEEKNLITPGDLLESPVLKNIGLVENLKK